jgi:hypothetical protein
MQEAVDYGMMHSVPKGFQSLFGESMGNGGRTRYVTDAKTIDFDVRDGSQRVTTLIHRGTVMEPLNKNILKGGNFTSFNRAFPLGEDEGIVSADQLLERAFGESPTPTLTRRDRSRLLARDLYDEMIRQAIRTQEILAAQMIKTGKMDLIIGTSKAAEQIDTKRLASHTITTGTSWATTTTDILGDNDTAADLIIQDSGAVCDCAIVGANVPGYIAANDDIQAFSNKLGPGGSGIQLIYFGENVKPGPQFNAMIANGFNPICRLVTMKGRSITYFTYEGGYKNAGGTFIPYMGANQVIWGSSQAACDRYFGPPEQLDPTIQDKQDYMEIFGFAMDAPQVPANVDAGNGVIVPAEFYPHITRAGDNKSYKVRMQYAPMYIARDVNAFAYTANVAP